MFASGWRLQGRLGWMEVSFQLLEPTGDVKNKVSDPWRTLMDAIQHFRHLYAHRGTGILPDDRPPGWLAFANLLLASNIALRIKMEPVPVIPKALELRKHRDPL